MKTFILVGGNFVNTGAQALTYVTVTELRKKYPDCDIYMVSDYDYKKDNSHYNFHVICFSADASAYFVNKKGGIAFVLKNKIKAMIGKNDNHASGKKFIELLHKCDGVFDISGFAISSQWGNWATEYKLELLALCEKHDVPYYFMPQSFGPFNYVENRETLVDRLSTAMGKCSVVFAREQDGYEALTQEIGLNNVRLSQDIVLQNKCINWDTVFKNNVMEKKKYKLLEGKKVAVIPNARNFDFGDKERILRLYTNLIDELIRQQVIVYLINHSAEDKGVCMLIKDMYPHRNDVILLDENFDCQGFEVIVKQFEFVLASRYHSIVHSYKNDVPCVIMGWAIKYRELANVFAQEQYMFDVRDEQSMDNALDILRNMICNYTNERTIIQEKLEIIQKNNCFDLMDF